VAAFPSRLLGDAPEEGSQRDAVPVGDDDCSHEAAGGLAEVGDQSRQGDGHRLAGIHPADDVGEG
jgi:hypothetical protein